MRANPVCHRTLTRDPMYADDDGTHITRGSPCIGSRCSAFMSRTRKPAEGGYCGLIFTGETTPYVELCWPDPAAQPTRGEGDHE